MAKYELVKFKDNDIELDVNVSPEEDTVWLSKEEIATLFERDRTVISKHINNIYQDGELDKEATCAKNAQVQIEGNRRVQRVNELYNLDVIISVGYRVKSTRGIAFRKWANSVLKQFLLKGYVLDSSRIIISIDNFLKLESDISNVKQELVNLKHELFIEPVKARIFFDGQFFDAYEFLCLLVKKAKHKLVVIDPYFDMEGLKILKWTNKNVKTIICLSGRTKLKQDDIEIFEKQYFAIQIIKKDCFHDRFIIVDNECYSLGASFNTFGKKVFAINKIEDNFIILSIFKKLET